jgi:hypothetical protein
MIRGEHLAHSISFALIKAQKVVRGLRLGLTDKERWDVACKTVEHLKEHGGRWRLNAEDESPVIDAHSTPRSFTEAHAEVQRQERRANAGVGICGPWVAPVHHSGSKAAHRMNCRWT